MCESERAYEIREHDELQQDSFSSKRPINGSIEYYVINGSSIDRIEEDFFQLS